MPAPLRERIRLGAKRQLTLPRNTLAKLRLREGDYLELRVAEDHIELVPLAMIPRDQLWFWTREWQKMEQEAELDVSAGRYRDYRGARRAIAALKS